MTSKQHSCYSYASKIPDLNSTHKYTLDILTFRQMVFYFSFFHSGHQEPCSILIHPVRNPTVNKNTYSDRTFVVQ